MATRDDHVMTVSYPDGTTILEHADGTRITTYYRETQIPLSENGTDDDGNFILTFSSLSSFSEDCSLVRNHGHGPCGVQTIPRL